MLQDYNKWRVAGVFFKNPLPEGGGFQLREISRAVKLAPISVKRYLKELEAEGILLETKSRAQGFPLYNANIESEKYRFYKKLNALSLIFESGLLNYLQDKAMPDAIVLFGSVARGEDTEQSDIDLYMQCKQTKMELDKFEKAIGRNINILYSKKLSQLSSELKNNILNGIIIKGYLKVF